MLAGGDELLHAIENPGVAATFRTRGDRGGIRARGRLGEAKTPEELAARKLRQIAFLLLIGTEGRDRPAHHRILYTHDRRRGAVACRDFLHRERQRYVIETRTTPALGHDHAQHAEPR